MDRLVIIFLVFNFLNANGQESIDGSFEFQSDPNKKYSIYIPSTYKEDQSNALMVGLHPRNVNRWDSESWRDTLINFAELNNLILACPDGGIDGGIDDDIDTAFTSVLIDSMSLWFNIDESQKYLMGFSWGGKTVYSYGLRRVDEFAGFLPIGAAISGASEISPLTPNATHENWYIVHGSNDNPSTRFTPAVEQLTEAGACIESLLMQGVNHTIDFPNRDEILSTAFEFIRDANCISTNINLGKNIKLYTSPNPSSSEFIIHGISPIAQIVCYNIKGQEVPFIKTDNKINIQGFRKELILVRIKDQGSTVVLKQFVNL